METKCRLRVCYFMDAVQAYLILSFNTILFICSFYSELGHSITSNWRLFFNARKQYLALGFWISIHNIIKYDLIMCVLPKKGINKGATFINSHMHV